MCYRVITCQTGRHYFQETCPRTESVAIIKSLKYKTDRK